VRLEVRATLREHGRKGSAHIDDAPVPAYFAIRSTASRAVGCSAWRLQPPMRKPKFDPLDQLRFSERH
jgi:hypothetical protein